MHFPTNLDTDQDPEHQQTAAPSAEDRPPKLHISWILICCFVTIMETLQCSCCFLVISYWQWPLSPQSHLLKRTIIPGWSTVPAGLPCLFKVRGDYQTLNAYLFHQFYPAGEHSLSYPDNLLSLRAFGQRSCWKTHLYHLTSLCLLTPSRNWLICEALQMPCWLFPSAY